MKKILPIFLAVLFLSACAGQETARDTYVAGQEDDEMAIVLSDSKETLVLGIYPTVDDPLRQSVFYFNTTNPLYQIALKEYEDSDQLNADIMTGRAPDIILLPPYFMMDIYADKGVFADLYPLLDADPGIDRADLQENILRAYETGGQLFAMPVTYYIMTATAARANMGEMSSWTLEEMMAYANGLLPESHVFSNHSKSRVLDLCLMLSFEQLTGWNDGGLFDRGLFLKIIHFANQFTPDHYYKSGLIFDQIRDGQVQVEARPVYDLSSVQFLRFIFNEPIVYIGYPTDDGNGSFARSETLVAISQSCPYPEAAWSFLRSMLDEVPQFNFANISLSLPIRKSALEEYMYNYVLTNRPGGRITFRGSDVVFEFYRATEDEKQELRDLIDSITKIRSWDARIDDILREEAQAFLTGEKSADDAADIAANRIEIYLSEIR
ncbi:MAG: ABC transporter substrate-binding protein [Lachnospiraceae bacterium]|nr:ABC transporter substrate-binding protein [Lachnospiraceae bacterium]